MKFKPTFLLCLAVLVLSAASGCNLFRKSKKPKANPAIAAELEATFQQRWVEQRIVQLAASGVESAAARQQAEAEFREKFPHLAERRK